MIFTDDDLKWLKELIDGKVMAPKFRGDLQALLARLEASEKIVSSSHNDDSGTMSVCLKPCPRCDAESTWQKAAGK